MRKVILAAAIFLTANAQPAAPSVEAGPNPAARQNVRLDARLGLRVDGESAPRKRGGDGKGSPSLLASKGRAGGNNGV